MRQPIMLKLLISYIVFGFAGFGIVITLTNYGSHKYFIQKEIAELRENAKVISNEYYQDEFESISDYKNVSSLTKSLTPDNCVTWIITNDGHITYSTNKGLIDYIPDFDIKKFGTGTYAESIYNDYLSFDSISTFMPIYSAGTVDEINSITKDESNSEEDEDSLVGYVIIHLNSDYINELSEELVLLTTLTGLVILLLSFLPLFIVIIFVYKPLLKINKAAKEFAKGNFKVNKITVTSHDEFSELADSLNTMATQLSEREEFQRKFISNVSHDFRSPLTSIKGYIEAMLDGTIPEEMHNKYLKVVLTETNRLTKLAAGLIDLSAVDSDDIVLFQSVFDLNTIIFDTVSVFEGQCRKKNVLIDLNFESEIYEVYADKDKITQVFSNLIDNAIKFSDNDSTITVHVYDKGSKVYVSVKDKGVGIAKDSIDKIFDRFYKSDTSRGRVKNSSGIGLSIVKEILQAHNEKIEVNSVEGEGAEFVFTVPKKGTSANGK